MASHCRSHEDHARAPPQLIAVSSAGFPVQSGILAFALVGALRAGPVLGLGLVALARFLARELLPGSVRRLLIGAARWRLGRFVRALLGIRVPGLRRCSERGAG